jgi:DNA-binding LacI/PurR family transcriptional regulator
VVVSAAADSTAGPAAFRAGAEAFLGLSEPPDAVFALYEGLAAQVLRLADERDILVPEQLLVATVSELGTAEATDPPLTTLELSQTELGATAARLLMDLVEDEPAGSVVDVPTRLVPRRSTARG